MPTICANLARETKRKRDEEYPQADLSPLGRQIYGSERAGPTSDLSNIFSVQKALGNLRLSIRGLRAGWQKAFAPKCAADVVFYPNHFEEPRSQAIVTNAP
ncbi:MAG: hypothetical protein JWM47_4499 [Acidimicrobiales bacterium]|nr:hypothetical protein [Acidimicrobiales bacterium]